MIPYVVEKNVRRSNMLKKIRSFHQVLSFNFNVKLFLQIIIKLCKDETFLKMKHSSVSMTQDFVILNIPSKSAG